MESEIERFLTANAGKLSRERLTLIRIYEELRALGYDGSYDAIRRYAKGWSKDRGAVTAEAYVPLYYAPGEAYQFDWSHEIVLIRGVTTTVKVAHVRYDNMKTAVEAVPLRSAANAFTLSFSLLCSLGPVDKVWQPYFAATRARKPLKDFRGLSYRVAHDETA